MHLLSLKYIFPILSILVLCISFGMCQDEDEDDEDTYDEEVADGEKTTKRYRVRPPSTSPSSVTISPNASRADGNGTEKASPETVAVTPAATPSVQAAPPPLPPAIRVTPRPRTPPTAATTPSEDDEDFEPTEEEGYGYIFRPLNSLVDNIVAGNVTGIVDHALSIRTPPEIRVFVNHVMSNVFNSGISGALKQYVPNIFSTKAPPSAQDRIPTRARPPTRRFPNVEPIPSVESRSNATGEEVTVKKKYSEVAVKIHPGAPASRLRCEVIS